MKTIYFVRHGQSEGNANRITQGSEPPLTLRGREQAAIVRDRATRLPIEKIISSTMARARETTAVILEKVVVPVEYSDLFVERRRPSEMFGVAFDDPRALEMDIQLKKNFHIEGARLSDEEIFIDIKKRACLALEHLARQKHDHVLVVTHGFFLRVLVAYLFFGEGLNSHECRQFIHLTHTTNTGITIFNFHGEGKSKWSLVTWNDYAHLG